MAGFDAALIAGEDEFVKRRIYLTLERGRDIALRNLFRKVFLASGFDEPSKEGEERTRRTRIPVKEFAAAMKVAGGAGDDLEDDEVECLLANLIYKVRISEITCLFGMFGGSRADMKRQKRIS